MAFSHGSKARVWLKGRETTVVFSDVNADENTQAADTTTLGNTAKQYIPGLSDAKTKIKGFFSSDSVSPTTSFEYFFDSVRRTIFPVTFMTAGNNSLGDPVRVLYGFLTSATVDTSATAAAKLNLEFTSNIGMQSNSLLVTDAARTTTANGSNLDNTTSSASGGSATLQLSAVSGTASPSVAVIIEHSTTGAGSWSTIGTFATKTAAGAEYITFSGTVNRYVRASWTVTGTTPSFTFNVSVHRN